MLYPLRFQPICQERIWGGSGLRDEFGRELPGDKIGESWEITCRAEAESRVAAGPLQGKALGELCALYGAALLGEKIAKGNTFPLLLKILDAQDVLSVQVHPDDNFALFHEASAGKSEVWYILKARPGAKIVYGLRPGVTQQDLMAALKRGDLAACLHEVAVRPGEVYPIPPGLVHALGKGIMVVELQQNSDLTYRVFDWNRVDQQGRARPLHIEKALQVIEFGLVPPGPLRPEGDGLIFANEYFSLAFHRVTTEKTMLQNPEAFTLLTVVAGKGELWHRGKAYPLQYGDSYLLPACLGQYVLRGDLALLLGWPNKPLQLAGAGYRAAVSG